MSLFLRALSLGILTLILPVPAQTAFDAVVRVPVADIRRTPSLPEPGKSDELQETQVLFGETVLVTGSSGTWASIEAPEQQEFTHQNRWQGYPGWVQASALALSSATLPAPTHVVGEKWAAVCSKPGGRTILRLPLGARARRLRKQSSWTEIDLHDSRTGWVQTKQLRSLSGKWPPHRWRLGILATAKLLMGDPYVWGGLSPFEPTGQTRLSGVDCSGLVHLSYRVNGVALPRDSHEQYMRAEKIKRRQLQPADLIFSAPEKEPQKVTHVALYVEKDWLLEAPQTGLAVRRIRAQEKFGQPLSKIESGDVVGERLIYFGRYLPAGQAGLPP